MGEGARVTVLYFGDLPLWLPEPMAFVYCRALVPGLAAVLLLLRRTSP
jgi:hypothetical protein